MPQPTLQPERLPGIRRAINFLGLHHSMAAMLTMAILVGMGENMAERFLPVYLLALGGGALAVSLSHKNIFFEWKSARTDM